MRTPLTPTRGLAATLALLLVSACAGIPAAGPVTRVAADDGFGQSTVRYSPARPTADASPQQIVRGYLDAMLAFPVSTGTASAFLTPAAAKNWRSLATVRVYSEPKVFAPVRSFDKGRGDGTGDGVEVRLNVVDEVRLDRQGRYTKLAGESDVGYRLEQVDGEWRITNPQAGLLVNRKFFGDYFRPFDIFMFDRPGRRLVPVPVYLAVGDQLATALVTSLARGPGRDQGHTMRTYVPPLRALSPSVPLTDEGIADVAFNEDFGSVTESRLDRLSAQITWTLRQVPEITSIRVAGRSATVAPNGLAVQSIGSWGAFGPSIARGHVFALTGDRVVQIDDGRIEPLTGLWGKDAYGAVLVAVSDTGVAGVLSGRSQVRLTKRGGTAARLIAGSGFVAPSWDDDGGLWLVDRPAGDARVRLIRGGTQRTLPIGKLSALNISTFSISPDDSRYAVTTSGPSGAVYVGAIRRDVKDQLVGLEDPERLSTTAAKPVSAVWTSATGLAFLADSESGRQVYSAIIDGSATTGGVAGGGALLPDVGADVVVTGTGESPRYATDARRRVWFLPPDGSWRLLEARGVTGLSYGR